MQLDSDYQLVPTTGSALEDTTQSPPAELPLPLLLLIVLVTLGLGGISVYLAYSNSLLQGQLQSVQASNAQLAASVAGLGEDNDSLLSAFVNKEVNATPSETVSSGECNEPLVNIGVGSYRVPCDWHSSFYISTASETSTGYANPTPIEVFVDGEVRTAAVTTILNRYATELDNYQTDPLAETIQTWRDQDVELRRERNNNDVNFWYIPAPDTSDQDIDYYYSQFAYQGDLYTIEFQITESQKQNAGVILDSFNWD